MPKPNQHPTGITALATAAVVIVCEKAGVDLDAEEAAIFIGLAAAVVSYFTPRWNKRTIG